MKAIAVIYGSDSSEWEISCRSGEFVSSKIDGQKYDVYEIFARFGTWQVVSYRLKNSTRIILPEDQRPDIDKNDFSVVIEGEKIKLDYAYIMQHGTPGENGLMQGYLEMLNIPHSGCSSFVSAITFDKMSSKDSLRKLEYVNCAKDIFLRDGDLTDNEKIVSYLGLPLFVKPTDAGSSFGVTKVKSIEELNKAFSQAFAESDTIMAEQMIEGRELTCAAYKSGEKVVALPIIEIVTENEYFDYDAKYNGKSEEICPALISQDLELEISNTSIKLYKHFGCSGVVRFDYIEAKDGLYFLEVNTIPGMTSASLIPKMVRTAGINMTEFLEEIIEN